MNATEWIYELKLHAKEAIEEIQRQNWRLDQLLALRPVPGSVEAAAAAAAGGAIAYQFPASLAKQVADAIVQASRDPQDGGVYSVQVSPRESINVRWSSGAIVISTLAVEP